VLQHTHLFLGIEADTLANEVVALAAPHVEGHLKPDDKNPLAKLLCAFPQWVLPIELRCEETALAA
jgi:hypothetical protein